MPGYTRPASMGGSFTWTDTARTDNRFHGDPDALAADLRRRLRGEVRFDSGSRAVYSTDASNYRQVPVGVVLPHGVDDLVEAVAVCREHGAPITHRGAGTSLAGQTVSAGVIIDGSKYLDHIVAVDPDRKVARVQPGVRRDDLARVTEPRYHLTFAPDTSTHRYATFGGMIGNNSCGVHSQMAGRTEDNVEALDILTYDGCRMVVGKTSEEELERIIRDGGRRGAIYQNLRDLRDRYADRIRERFPPIPRVISGYNLYALLPENGFDVARALVGTEGTCVTILEATVRLVHSPPHRVMVVMGYDDVFEAGDHVAEIGELGPIGLEGLDDRLIRYMEMKKLHAEYLPLLPRGNGFLFVEFGGDTMDEARDRAKSCMETLRRRHGDGAPSMELFEDPKVQRMLWEIREAGLAATAHVEDETWPGWEDSAIPPERVGDYLRELRALYDRYDYTGALYGHFGQGCIHTRISFDLRSERGIQTYRRFMDDASDLCLKYGGSLSAEHGDGQARGELIPKMFGEALAQAFREFKAIWDPDWKMNPGTIVDPYRMDQNLRLGTDYHPPALETHFAYPEDDFDFSHAALRCVGVGKCRQVDLDAGEVMCPSYIATREEMHSTRGRARLLFEMLNGTETPDAWDNDDVHEALDLCLACKGCKNDCPVNVDMATYKAEFLSHYYEHHRRPRYAYAFGLIHWWARLASYAPRLANAATQTPGLGRLVRAIGGVTQEREIPVFATQTFQDWFFRRGVRNEGHPRVILFPDTFNNFFHVGTARAAVEVLEAAGYQVVVPRQTLCCGRPLYDYGWLDLARRLWYRMMDALRDEIRAGTPIVGLEPSCVSAFRDELLNFFPNDEDARRLSKNVHTLGEFLVDVAEDYTPPRLERRALMHGHCHHRAVMGTSSEEQLFESMGLDVEVLKSTCCGVAGSFGFEHDHYDVSMACGEHVLLPSVREAAPETFIITDGFSCRHQVAHGTDRRALHLSEVLHLALHQDAQPHAYPERPYVRAMHHAPTGSSGPRWLPAVAAFVTSAAVTWALSRR